ncbi:uroporphyrinogen decarboxylase chloroplastic [Phtheirospermum japonicum]|uniref:Uroporphyrinogen decarboxylase chloroplastic n=1 Tax=Phtheirospermum japonicum TaxID=374723 RepID=A0A830C947_9LAMI|nr:uroporphyrinogen decarboxylase chloroplastic [Phtheirospermum japonicum]
MLKLLLHIPPSKGLDAVITICYEAQARLRDPIYGCVAHIFALQQQLNDRYLLFLRELLAHRHVKVDDLILMGNLLVSGAVAEPKAVNATEPLLLNAARRQRSRETPGVAYETSRESYQTLCEKHPSFRERSENVDLVVEISLQPWKVFKPDGVILFSDILTPLSAGDVEKVREFTPDESVPYVGEALTILRKERECVEDCSGSAQEELREKASDHDGGLKAVKIESVDVLVAAEKCTSSENDSGSCLG